MKAITNNDNNSCSVWDFLKGFLIFAVIIAICLLSIVITWMSGEISDLRERLKSGSNINRKFTSDIITSLSTGPENKDILRTWFDFYDRILKLGLVLE